MIKGLIAALLFGIAYYFNATSSRRNYNNALLMTSVIEIPIAIVAIVYFYTRGGRWAWDQSSGLIISHICSSIAYTIMMQAMIGTSPYIVAACESSYPLVLAIIWMISVGNIDWKQFPPMLTIMLGIAWLAYIKG